MSEEISEEVGVGVLAELVEDKPVTKIAVVKDITTGGEISMGEPPGLHNNHQHSEHK